MGQFCPRTNLVSGSVLDARQQAAFARGWRRAEHERLLTASRKAFVPLVFAPGEAFQFDWSEDWVRVGGEKVKLQVAQLGSTIAEPTQHCWDQTRRGHSELI